MLQPGRQAPVLSPLLFVGLALRPAPKPALQAAASFAVSAMLRQHKSVFERLEDIGNPVFLIDPIDLPVSLLLDTRLPAPSLTVLRESDDPGTPAASIRGSLPTLIDLLEGRIDGDALFFSRDLAVEGDMAAVVALRNAVDGADISLFDDLLRPLGPLGGPARAVADLGGMLYRSAERDLETLRAALVAPVQRRCDAQEAQLRDLDETVANMPTRRRERQS